MEKDTMFHCPVEAALSLISGKYKCIILWHLMQRTHRYGELHRLIPQATAKMLTQQLRELITGQNPASDIALAKELDKALQAK